MKKVIVVGALAAGLVALAGWRMRQSKTKPEEEFGSIPDEFSNLPSKEEPVGV